MTEHSTSPQILVVDDEPDIRRLIGEILSDFNYIVTEVHDAAAARSAVRLQRFDAVLLDIWMPGDDGITLLKEWYDSGFTTPVIMLSAHGSIETAVEATRFGAYDYLEKPVSVGRLEITVRNAIRNAQAPADYPSKSKPAKRVGFVGSSSTIKTLRSEIKKLSQLGTRVLLIGEVGSGRTLAARMIHHERGREIGRFKVLDWQLKATWEHSIAESLDEAADGTLLIRDIHTYDKYSQNQFLGLLDEVGERKIGSDGLSAPDIMATATESIYQRMVDGKFRPELYYRLNESLVRVPPLRDHLEDIPELVGYLVDGISRDGNLPYRRISTAGLNCLRNHAWKGNVEELKNILLKVMLSTSAETITDAELRPVLETWEVPAIDTMEDTNEVTQIFGLTLNEARENFEREYLRYHLRRCRTQREVEEAIGIHRSNIFRKMRKYGIEVGTAKDDGFFLKEDEDS